MERTNQVPFVLHPSGLQPFFDYLVLGVEGTELDVLLGGLVVTETVFTLNGVGGFLVDAIAHRDLPVVTSLVLISTVVTVFVNLAVDLFYSWLDPRITYS